MDIIGDVFLAFLLKENLPIEEAEDLVGKVREKKLEDSICLFIESCHEFGVKKEEIVDKLIEKCQLEPEEAGKMVEIYSKDK